MAIRPHTLLIPLAVLAFPVVASPADLIKLKNGYTIRGHVILENEHQVTIEAHSGLVTLDRDRIERIVKEPVPTPGEPTSPPSRGAEVRPGHVTHELERWAFSLPETYQRLQTAGGDPTSSARALGSFGDPDTGARVTIEILEFPFAVERDALYQLVWEGLVGPDTARPELRFRDVDLNGQRAILADVRQTEKGAQVRVVSAYVFGLVRGFAIFTVSVPETEFAKDPERYRGIRASLVLRPSRSP